MGYAYLVFDRVDVFECIIGVCLLGVWQSRCI